MAAASFLHWSNGMPCASASNTWIHTWSAPASKCSVRRLLTVSTSPHESEPKTRRGTASPAPAPATLAALEEPQARQEQERADVGTAWIDSGLVFARPDGSAIHPDLITDWFRRLARAAGLPPLRRHDRRHRCA